MILIKDKNDIAILVSIINNNSCRHIMCTYCPYLLRKKCTARFGIDAEAASKAKEILDEVVMNILEDEINE